MNPYANELAEHIYTVYCREVGGKAFNGDPLPDWKTFASDPTKKKQSEAWLAAASAAIFKFNDDLKRNG